MSESSEIRRLEDRIDHVNREGQLRLDAVMAKIEGKLEVISAKLSGIDTRFDAVEKATSGVKATVIGTGVALVAVTIGILAYGQAWFGIGVSTRDVIRATVAEYQASHPQSMPATAQPPR